MTDHNVTTVKSVMTRSSGTASKYPTLPVRSPHLSVRFSSFLPWVGKENEIIPTTGGLVLFLLSSFYTKTFVEGWRCSAEPLPEVDTKNRFTGDTTL